MNKVLLVAVAVLAMVCGACAAMSESDMRNEFEAFSVKHNKQYADAVTREARYQIFRTNLIRAEELNAKAGVVAHGVTRFSDMTPSELSHFLTYKRSANRKIGKENMAKPIRKTGGVPATFDWRQHGAVTPVRDQGQCGSCWAFSATEQVESAMLLKYHNSTTKTAWLAAQQVVDCDTGAGDYGCNGGDTITAYAYMIKAGGFEAEKTYPYKAVDGQCKYSASRSVTKVTGWSWTIPSCEKDSACDKQDEEALAQSMTTKGPASICVAASNDWFSYTGPAPFAGDCNHGYFDLNHCIQLVGFTNTGSGGGYWIGRNSWGTGWGDQGFIYLKYGVNSCGLADEVTYVEVA